MVANGEALAGTISQISGLGMSGVSFSRGSLEDVDGLAKGGNGSIILTRFEYDCRVDLC